MTTTLIQPPTVTPRLAVSTSPARLIQLDVLRGIAILLVVGRHYVIDAHFAGWLLPIAGAWQRFGWTGVDLFFVLSGFLVGGLLCAEIRNNGSLDVKRFIIRRGLKIWPSYYLLLLFVAIVGLWDYPRYLTLNEIDAPLWPSLFHYQNYYRVLDVHHHWIPSLPREHLWSLAVEEHFYLIIPFLLLLFLYVGRGSSRRLATLPIIAIAAMVTCTLLRCFTHNLVPFPWGTHVYPTHMRIDGLFFGLLLAYFYHFKPGFMPWVIRNRWALFIVGFLLIAPMAIVKMEDNAWVPAVGFTMLYLGYGCILMAALATPPTWLAAKSGWQTKPAALFRALAWVGLFSYPIYLWHIDFGRFPVRYLMDFVRKINLPAVNYLEATFPALRWFVYTTLYVTLAIVTGCILGKLVEKPVLLFRDRLFPRRAEALSIVQVSPEPPESLNGHAHLNGQSISTPTERRMVTPSGAMPLSTTEPVAEN